MKLCVLSIFVCITFRIEAQILNGFDLSDAVLPLNQILRGGPSRDGIPSIDDPKFKPSSQYQEFGRQTEVLGVFYNDLAKAYPITIMDWHEIVNDEFGGIPVVVTYCPLCGSGIAFESSVEGETLQFGVSGLLYNSDVLLYDRNSNSLWSQIMAEAVSGIMTGKRLQVISTQRMKLGTWRALHPETLILTTDTGFIRDYTQGPYGDYNHHDRTYFPVSHDDNTLHKKEWIFGIEVNGIHKAYPISELKKLKTGTYQDSLGGTSFTLSWVKGVENLRVQTIDGQEIIGLQMFWFAWAAFHPTTMIMD